MWKKLLSHFEAPAVDQPDREQLALAVLLLECARADFESSDVELAAAREGLRAHFSLSDSELEKLLAAAGEQSRNAVSMFDYVRQLNAALQPADKSSLMRLLWRVAFADGRLDPHEEALLRRLAELLYIPHAEFITAKLEVAAQNPHVRVG